MEVIETLPTTGGAMGVDDAAAYLAIGRSSLYGLVRSGQLRIIKVGRRSIFARSELDAYLAKLTQGAA